MRRMTTCVLCGGQLAENGQCPACANSRATGARPVPPRMLTRELPLDRRRTVVAPLFDFGTEEGQESDRQEVTHMVANPLPPLPEDEARAGRGATELRA